MQPLKVIFMTLLVIKLCSSASLPNDGSFHYNIYQDNRCKNRVPNVQTNIFPVIKSSCWYFSDEYSIKIRSYDKTTNTLVYDVYQSGNCTGDKLILDVSVKTDGSECYLSSPLFYNIIYVNISTKEDLKFVTYYNQGCSREIAARIFRGQDNCWNIFGSSSLSALNWNEVTKELSGTYFENDNLCETYESDPSTQLSTISCDGSCSKHPKSQIYFTCEYDSSAKLLFSLFSALVLLFIFI